MERMDRNLLLDSLAQYGYPMLRAGDTKEPEEVLDNLLCQDDARLLEGFPVVFGNALKKKELLRWEERDWSSAELPKKSGRRLGYLLALSYCVFQLFGFEKGFSERAFKLLTKMKNGKDLFRVVNESFMKSHPVVMDKVKLSTERLKKNFRNYFLHAEEDTEVQKHKHVLELELLLSELFTPRQKELLKKRLEGKPLTKTEKEYFYRVVKKRLKALANEELHQMAREVMFK